jgi:FMN reductase
VNSEVSAAVKPHVVGIGGTTTASSSTQKVLMAVLAEAERAGATTELICGPDLAQLPLYAPEHPQRTPEQQALLASVRRADGLILATPAYHAGISGLVKNAIDLLEDLRTDARPYLDGRAVGCIVTGFGWQGCGTTLTSVRTIVHALRGWPTPLGVTLNTAEKLFNDSGAVIDPKVQGQLAMLAQQVVGFARQIGRR